MNTITAIAICPQVGLLSDRRPLAVQNVVALTHEGDQNRIGHHAAPLASAAAAICRRRSGVAAGNPK